MKKAISILAVLCISLTLTTAIIAQTTPGVTKRQKNQKQKIKQGVSSGELTGKETRKLKKEQQNIKQEKREAKADGKVTVKERVEIHQDQNQARKNIIKAKHNKKNRKP